MAFHTILDNTTPTDLLKKRSRRKPRMSKRSRKVWYKRLNAHLKGRESVDYIDINAPADTPVSYFVYGPSKPCLVPDVLPRLPNLLMLGDSKPRTGSPLERQEDFKSRTEKLS